MMTADGGWFLNRLGQGSCPILVDKENTLFRCVTQDMSRYLWRNKDSSGSEQEWIRFRRRPLGMNDTRPS
jgi:hypothetical protein